MDGFSGETNRGEDYKIYCDLICGYYLILFCFCSMGGWSEMEKRLNFLLHSRNITSATTRYSFIAIYFHYYKYYIIETPVVIG